MPDPAAATSSTALATIPADKLDLYLEVLRRETLAACEKSLEAFLDSVVIDARPQPVRWGKVIEKWQQRLARRLIPAIEAMTGQRKDYTGPRWFYIVLPRGHDKTGITGRIAEWSVGFAKRRMHGIACASDTDQAMLLRNSVDSEVHLTPWLRDHIQVLAKSIRGPRGAIDIISSDAGSSSGAKCDLFICDELTFWKGRELFDVLFSGAAKRHDAVFIIITNAGLRGSWQHELLEKAKADAKNWYVFEAPVGRQLASWMTADRVNAIREMLPRGHARRVLDNEWIDATETPLLTPDAIARCEDARCLWPDERLSRIRIAGKPRRELYVGVDIGRYHDRTIVATLERLQGVLWLRSLVEWRDKQFVDQEFDISEFITPEVLHANIDRGGIGSQIAENLEREFPIQVEGIAITAGLKGRMALLMKHAFESGTIRVPPDSTLRRDLQQVSEITTSTGGVPVLKTDRTEIGHADRFWAIALALLGVPHEQQTVYTRSPITAVRSVASPRRIVSARARIPMFTAGR